MRFSFQSNSPRRGNRSRSDAPSDINRQLTRTNRTASLDVKAIPLDAANGQGPTRTILNL